MLVVLVDGGSTGSLFWQDVMRGFGGWMSAGCGCWFVVSERGALDVEEITALERRSGSGTLLRHLRRDNGALPKLHLELARLVFPPVPLLQKRRYVFE